MSIQWLLTNLLAAFLLPPLSCLVLLTIGLCFLRRRPLLGRIITGVSVFLLWVLAIPAVGDLMLRSLEGEMLTHASMLKSQAIVVLGGGSYREAPEYGGDTVREETLLRLRYAAKLQRESGLPLLVTGGNPEGGKLSEGETMRRVLTDEFGVPVRWVEGASENTRQNAQLSASLLKADGIERVLLVTHAWHMARASASFREAGLTVFPAPTFFHRQPLTLLDFLPKNYAESRAAIHEWIGLIWYRLRSL